MYKVLVAETIAEAGVALLREAAEVDVKKVSADELLASVAEYDAVITRSATQITRAVLQAGARLKVVGRAGVGVDNIDVEAATERGVVVVNVPGANSIAVAEHTLGLMLAMARHIPQAHGDLVAGKWNKSKYMGTELMGKTLGVIGLGRIGAEVVSRARAFGMKVLAYDPYVTMARADQLGSILVSLDELLTQSDYVSVHTAKTSETAHLLGSREIGMMKPGARLVNCARGGIVDEQALAEAIAAGRLAGAGLDVFEQEPVTEHPLFGLPGVIVTPHVGGSTAEAQEANGVIVARQVLRVLQGELVAEAVNLPALPPVEAKKVADYLPLADVLGHFLSQAFGGTPDQIEVQYQGELAELRTDLLTNTAVKGYLAGVMEDENINYINAATIARRRGIGISERKANGKATRISVQVRSGEERREVSGLIGPAGDMRIVSVNAIPLDFHITRYLLVGRNQDRPGMIGRFGTILGEANVNIAGMQLGRLTRHGEAVVVMQVDAPVDPKTLADLAQLPGIIEIRSVVLPQVPSGLPED